MEILFKDKNELGMSELKRDAVFSRIPPERYDEMISFSWQTGESAARDYTKKTGSSIPSEMAKRMKLKIKSENWEQGHGNVRVYSEYEDKFNLITLHPNVISAGIQKARSHGLNQVKSYAAARELFIAHEIFHHLECRKLGLTSRKMEITTFQFGPVKIKSGIRALCEIAAHAFTRTLYDMNNGYPNLQNKESDRYDE